MSRKVFLIGINYYSFKNKMNMKKNKNIRGEVMSTFDRISEEKNWYVLHTYSGYEKKVEQNLSSRMRSMETK